MTPERILLREGIRNDALWTNRLTNNKWADSIPLYLDTRALLESQYWPRERLDELTRQNIAKTLSRAGKLPFWHERFKRFGINPAHSTSNDLLKLPILTKNDLRASREEDYTEPSLLPVSHVGRTSGSTAAPFRFFHDRAFVLSSYGFCERLFLMAGKGTRYPVISMRQFDRPGFAFKKYHFFYVRGYNGIKHRLTELRQLLERYPGGVLLFSFSSSLLELARLCKAEHLSLPIRGLMFGGESMRDSHRAEIEESLHAQVFGNYGGGEMGRIAFECEQRQLHINEERIRLEVLNERDEAVGPDIPGRVVVTVFDNAVMPFIRYETGDIGMVHSKACSCGRTLKTVSMQGRTVQLLQFGPNRTVSLLDMLAVFDMYWNSVQRFQIVRTGEYSFTLRVVPGEQFASKQDEIAEKFSRVIHPAATVAWEIVDSISEGPSGKALHFLDKWDQSSASIE